MYYLGPYFYYECNLYQYHYVHFPHYLCIQHLLIWKFENQCITRLQFTFQSKATAIKKYKNN